MVSLAEVVDLLRGISFRWIVLFLLLSFSMSLFRAWRSQLVLNASGYHPNTIALFLIILVRNFFSDLLPARLGTLIYIYLVQTRLGIAFGPAASSFAYDFVFDMVSLALLIILAVLVQTSTLISSTGCHFRWGVAGCDQHGGSAGPPRSPALHGEDVSVRLDAVAKAQAAAP